MRLEVCLEKLFRNTEYIFNGNNISFGVLTGEESALNHINIQQRDLDNVHYIACITDGYLSYFTDAFNKEVIEQLFHNEKAAIEISNKQAEDEQLERKKKPEEETEVKFGRERTLIALKRKNNIKRLLFYKSII